MDNNLCLFIKFKVLVWISFSKILLMQDRGLIGRQFVKLVGSSFLYTGITFAILNSSGYSAVMNTKLKMWFSIGDITAVFPLYF